VSTRRKLLIAGIILVVAAVVVLAASIVFSPFQYAGINYYALIGWLLAPLLVVAVLFSIGLTNVMMGFIIPEKFCIECGKPIDLDSKFCKYCGHEYAAEKAPAT
jgi:di/tricarboxylate transporter